MYRNFKSQLGYENGENKIDSYGVDHSNFSLRDEVSYQMARTNRENELIKNYNNQGITQDYPQYNTNFWGGNPANNYGFGSSNISDNIENVTNSLKNQNYGFDTNTNNIKPNNVYNTVGNNGTFNTANIQTPPQTLNQLPANRLNKANSMELFNNPPSSQMDLSLKPLNKSNSYTTESAWGFPNNSPKINYSLYGDDFSKEYINEILNDNRFQQAIKRTKCIEGGYSNNKNDKGGETNYGISSKYYPNENIKNMTPERASAIFYRDYWIKPKINLLPDEIADIVFDNSVVQGQNTSIKLLQKALGIKDDGIIGPATLNAFNNANYLTIKQNFINNVKSRIKNITKQDASQKIFEKGWIRRSNTY